MTSNRIALITGTNNPRGIGAATARALAARGVDIVAHYYRGRYEPVVDPLESSSDDHASAKLEPDLSGPLGMDWYVRAQRATPAKLVQEIHDAGGRAICTESDLSAPGAIERLFDQVEQNMGAAPDILVLNASVSVPDSLAPNPAKESATAGAGRDRHRFTAEGFDRHIAVNARTPALMIAEMARRHQAEGRDWGRIIGVSTDGASAFAGEVSYGASKHALESIVRAAALELGGQNITANLVSPGPIQTGWISEDFERSMQGSSPLGRIGTPEDVADVIAFLASDDARWLTGQLLYVGGGHLMHL